MEPVPADFVSLRGALEDHTVSWYLDLRSGEFIPQFDDPDLNGEFHEDIETQPELFLHVEPLPSREGFAIMEDFADELPEGEAKRSLARALRLPRPFRSFKDTLFDFPEEQQAWFKFQTARLHNAAIKFLEWNSVPWTSKYPQHDPPA